ncbi:ROK family protein [Gramella jeungdoensis]|uniref:ROK family protein n=1 Tax=Gramella jeungdoensis TaxID=708091 RepID=A0ABT0Z630_9FLAO|nr:ROK family protein [Gramella jeungdoensis]MCM8570865.1 ROK family protein [Gramella jeungdoensis]
MAFVIGVDIGGSHISSAVIDQTSNQIVENTYFSGYVNNKESKEEIYRQWSEIINKTLSVKLNQEVKGIGIAMPGPFQYKTGVAMFEKNDKYEALYGTCVQSELKEFLNKKDLPIRFLNDASSFGVGSTVINNNSQENIVAITLGTGFGATFLSHQIPVTDQDNVPKEGCLWDKEFRDGIADDYFSTRWFLKRFEFHTGEKMAGVKEIALQDNRVCKRVFEEFADNLSMFLYPYLEKFNTDLLIIGGNIAKADEYFLDQVINNWKVKDFNIPVIVIKNTEKSIIIGASFLFNESFWSEVKDKLPEL